MYTLTASTPEAVAVPAVFLHWSGVILATSGPTLIENSYLKSNSPATNVEPWSPLTSLRASRWGICRSVELQLRWSVEQTTYLQHLDTAVSRLRLAACLELPVNNGRHCLMFCFLYHGLRASYHISPTHFLFKMFFRLSAT